MWTRTIVAVIALLAGGAPETVPLYAIEQGGRSFATIKDIRRTVLPVLVAVLTGEWN